MTEPFALAPGAAQPARRGRPPGSRNKRAKDLAAFVDVTCGGTAALQLAKGCMVTSAEVKAAGGSLQRAELAKAAAMVEAFDAQAERLDQDLRSIVRDALADLLERAEHTTKGEAILRMVMGTVDRMQLAGGRLTLLGAMERMAEDRRALLPYTDQKQAQKLEVKDGRAPPVMVFMGGSPGEQKPVQIQGPVLDVPFEVLQPKSHDDQEA